MINIIHTSPDRHMDEASLYGGITRGMKNHKGVFLWRTDDRHSYPQRQTSGKTAKIV